MQGWGKQGGRTEGPSMCYLPGFKANTEYERDCKAFIKPGGLEGLLPGYLN